MNHYELLLFPCCIAILNYINFYILCTCLNKKRKKNYQDHCYYFFQNHVRSASCVPSISAYTTKQDTVVVPRTNLTDKNKKPTPSKIQVKSATKPVMSLKSTPTKIQTDSIMFKKPSPKSLKTSSPKVSNIPTRVTPPRKAKQGLGVLESVASNADTNLEDTRNKGGQITPSKSISRKRKGCTPVKSSDRISSPYRKMSKKSFDVYVDPALTSVKDVNTEKTYRQTSSKGLSEQNVNTGQSGTTTTGVLQTVKPEFKVPGKITPGEKRTEKENKDLHQQSVTNGYPQNTYTPQTGSNPTFKTPASFQQRSTFSTSGSFGKSNTCTSMKVTPPLCQCGRRSKRRMVQSPGQNMGRFFFSCAVRKSVASKDGCKFFKWETSGMEKISLSGSGISSNISKQFTPVVQNSYQMQSSYTSQKRSLGVRSVSAMKTPLR